MRSTHHEELQRNHHCMFLTRLKNNHSLEYKGWLNNKKLVTNMIIIKHTVPHKVLKLHVTQHTSVDVTCQTQETVFHWDIQTPRRGLKIRCAAEYF